MRQDHDSTKNKTTERQRRAVQDRNRSNEEQNHQRAQGGGQPDELGVTQGQNGEQGNTVNPRPAKDSGQIRH